MANLTLHFELEPRADKAAVSEHIIAQLDAAPGIECIRVDTDQATRSVSGSEILAAISVAGQVAGSVTAIIGALEKIQSLVKAGANNPGVRKVLIDVGLRAVPIDELTDEDKHEVKEQLTPAT